MSKACDSDTRLGGRVWEKLVPPVPTWRRAKSFSAANRARLMRLNSLGPYNDSGTWVPIRLQETNYMPSFVESRPRRPKVVDKKKYQELPEDLQAIQSVTSARPEYDQCCGRFVYANNNTRVEKRWGRSTVSLSANFQTISWEAGLPRRR